MDFQLSTRDASRMLADRLGIDGRLADAMLTIAAADEFGVFYHSFPHPVRGIRSVRVTCDDDAQEFRIQAWGKDAGNTPRKAARHG